MGAAVRIVNVPKALRDRLGDDGADALVELLNVASDSTKADALALSEEKYERRLSEEAAKLGSRVSEEAARLDRRITEESSKLDRRITEEVSKLNQRITDEVARLESRIAEEVSKLNQRITDEVARLESRIARLETRIADVRADLVRWMFVFWVGQIGALTAILFAFFRR